MKPENPMVILPYACARALTGADNLAIHIKNYTDEKN